MWVPVIQVTRPRGVAVNMSPCHGEDRQFKSDRGRHFFYLILENYRIK